MTLIAARSAASHSTTMEYVQNAAIRKTNKLHQKLIKQKVIQTIIIWMTFLLCLDLCDFRELYLKFSGQFIYHLAVAMTNQPFYKFIRQGAW